MSKAALERIAIAKATRSKKLDLRGLRLTSLPEELGELEWLEEMDLGTGTWEERNQLSELPEWMKKLTGLKSLDLGFNELEELPEWIGNLTRLEWLRLSGNQWRKFPDGMKRLVNLKKLFLIACNLSTLPDFIADLGQLEYLCIVINKLTAVPDWLAKMPQLRWLDMGSNELTALPDWLAEPQNLPKLERLNVPHNPLSTPPPEVLGDALDRDISAPLDAIRSYFRQLMAGAKVYFYEAKLLIIGEGGAGKTSLARKLKSPDYKLPSNEKSTEGIDIIHWSFPIPPELPRNSDNKNYTAKIWDFGGQEIYFATHQFFLTKRSVYLLVADTRKQHTDFYTWLLMQHTFGGDSPVILVKNRNRQNGNSFTIEDLYQLREQFPNLQEPVEVDLQEVPTGAGWRQLLQRVQEQLLQLPHIQQPRPATWVAVRRAVGGDRRNTINRKEFYAICADRGIKDSEDIKTLAEYMHNVGDVLYFQEDLVLQDCVILNPRWGLDAIYRVLDNRGIEQSLGKFSYEDVRRLWSEPEYQDYHNQLLRLMLNFRLCYELPGDKDTYIAPQLLGEAAPEYSWDSSNNLQVRYEYPDFMPRGILSRAIVKLHKNIEDQRLVWRSGVVLSDDYARAEVLELRSRKQIQVRVSGRNQRDLLMQIVRTLDDLHRSFPKLDYQKKVPCRCKTCAESAKTHFFDLNELLDRLADNKQTIECKNRPLYTKVTISELLNESGLLQRDDVLSRRFGRPGLLYSDLLARPDLDDDVMEAGAGDDRLSVVDTKESAAPREQVFVSYSHKDQKILNELLVHLKPLERSGKISTWSDKKIVPGADWMEEIRRALAVAKVAVMLVSPEFLASDFIHHQELGPLLEKTKRDGVIILWVPVRTCAVKDSLLSQYQAVIPPEKPISGMKKAEKDAAYLKIYEAIKEAVSRAQ